MAMKVFPVVGGCTGKGKRVGFQFGQQENRFFLGGSYTVAGDGASGGTETEETANGEFRYMQGYAGCRLCGNKFVYQCSHCSSFNCYDGKKNDALTCPVCGNTAAVPATQDDRIVCSSSYREIEIILAIDGSGSMRGERIKEVKRAAVNNFIFSFPNAKMALVTFSSKSAPDAVTTVLPFTKDYKRMKEAIEGLIPYGGTPSPLPHILTSFPSFSRQGGTDRYLVVFTDGAWVGDYRAVTDADKLKANGVVIITIGCTGADYDFLAAIATPGANIEASGTDFGQSFATAASKIKQS